MEAIGIIYKATNLVNGKIYIGKTSRKLEVRIKEHVYRANKGVGKSAFAQALVKYGENNFNWCVIDEAYSLDELNDKEVFWIEFYNSYRANNFQKGYNLTVGGEGVIGYKYTNDDREKIRLSRIGKNHSDETRVKIRLSNIGLQSGNKHPMFGKKFSPERCEKISKKLMNHNVSEETRRKLSKAHAGKKLSSEHVEKMRKNFTGEGNGMFGKTHSDESKDKISKANKGRLSGSKNPSAVSLVKLTKDNELVEKFNVAIDGAKSVNGDLSAIIKCCKGKRKTAYGFRWAYEEDYSALVGEVNE